MFTFLQTGLWRFGPWGKGEGQVPFQKSHSNANDQKINILIFALPETDNCILVCTGQIFFKLSWLSFCRQIAALTETYLCFLSLNVERLWPRRLNTVHYMGAGAGFHHTNNRILLESLKPTIEYFQRRLNTLNLQFSSLIWCLNLIFFCK